MTPCCAKCHSPMKKSPGKPGKWQCKKVTCKAYGKAVAA